MRNDFHGWYLALLQKQVDEEIQFLKTNGHDNPKIYIPCMFCIDTEKGYYRCGRLTELRQFASSIAINITKNRKEKNYRRPIGAESEIPLYSPFPKFENKDKSENIWGDSEPLIVIK